MKFCTQYKGNAIYIGKRQERSLWEKSSHALEIILETSSWRNYSLLESILGISSFAVKIHDGRQENFILLLTLLFGIVKVIWEIHLRRCIWQALAKYQLQGKIYLSGILINSADSFVSKFCYSRLTVNLLVGP